MALNDANCAMVSQHLWTQVRVWSISWSRSLIEISELMLSKSNFSSRTRPVGPLCSWQCFGLVLLNHGQGLEKDFWNWFVVYPFLFVIHCFFVILFVGFLLSCQHHWYLQKTAHAPIYPLFKRSNENTNELRLVFYFLREMPKKEKKKGRWQNKQTSNLQL